jgi:hypothetical protein
VDGILPHVPVRQWVLSLPHRLRYLVAWDHELCRSVLAVYARALLSFQRRRARRRRLRDGHSGCVTVIQRFGGGLNLNVHFHTLVLDGVFTDDEGDALRFRALQPPTDEEVGGVLATIYMRVCRLLRRRGFDASVDDLSRPDPVAEESPMLAGISNASIQGRIALGPRAGRRALVSGNALASVGAHRSETVVTPAYVTRFSKRLPASRRGMMSSAAHTELCASESLRMESSVGFRPPTPRRNPLHASRRGRNTIAAHSCTPCEIRQIEIVKFLDVAAPRSGTSEYVPGAVTDDAAFLYPSVGLFSGAIKDPRPAAGVCRGIGQIEIVKFPDGAALLQRLRTTWMPTWSRPPAWGRTACGS